MHVLLYFAVLICAAFVATSGAVAQPSSPAEGDETNRSHESGGRDRPDLHWQSTRTVQIAALTEQEFLQSAQWQNLARTTPLWAIQADVDGDGDTEVLELRSLSFRVSRVIEPRRGGGSRYNVRLRRVGRTRPRVVDLYDGSVHHLLDLTAYQLAESGLSVRVFSYGAPLEKKGILLSASLGCGEDDSCSGSDVLIVPGSTRIHVFSSGNLYGAHTTVDAQGGIVVRSRDWVDDQTAANECVNVLREARYQIVDGDLLLERWKVIRSREEYDGNSGRSSVIARWTEGRIENGEEHTERHVRRFDPSEHDHGPLQDWEPVCAACPFVYAYNEQGSHLQGEILRDLRNPGLETTQRLRIEPSELALINGHVVVELREQKDETTYLNSVFLDLNGELISPEECGSNSLFCAHDDARFLLRRGESIRLSFPIDARTWSAVSSVALVASGYYVPNR